MKFSTKILFWKALLWATLEFRVKAENYSRFCTLKLESNYALHFSVITEGFSKTSPYLFYLLDAAQSSGHEVPFMLGNDLLKR